MPSNTPQASAHRARQSLRSYHWIAEDADGKPLRNGAEFVHGLPCTNRREKRVALGTAKKYGCDERGKSHGVKCPMFKLQKIVEATQATEKAIGQAQKAIDALDALKAASAEPAANDAPAVEVAA